jgi:hypothetical protein
MIETTTLKAEFIQKGIKGRTPFSDAAFSFVS